MKLEIGRTLALSTITITVFLSVFLAFVWAFATGVLAAEMPRTVLRVDPGNSPSLRFREADMGVVSEGFQLTAELAHPVVAPGEPVVMTLTIHNVSQKELVLMESYPEHDYTLNILNAHGDLLQPTKDTSSVWRNISKQVLPGSHIVYNYSLDKVYDLSTAGDYYITAGQKVFRLDGEGYADVVSNTVVLTVTDNPQNAQAATSRSIPSKNERAAKSHDACAKPRLVDVRPILVRQGCSLVWSADKRKATVVARGFSATIQADSNVMVVAGKKVKMWGPAKLVNGQLRAPGDAVSKITARCTSRG
ncbi:MAG: copper amine oxidase N-terminal domain-containing protein [Armatimonadetes bacterium]|nr:copper amine oxidase N-terminal domain-containing protein [Armatimonadota bacterium]